MGPHNYDVVPYVCTAMTTSGFERAGNATVALDALARNPAIDASDMVVLGASHGGWMAVELVECTSGGSPPPGLAAWPEPPATLRAHISALVLLYPY